MEASRVASAGIVVVEDFLLVRESIARAIDRAPFTVAGLAATGGEGIALVRAHEPEIVLADYGLPDRSGIDLLREVRHARPATRVVVITGEPDPELAVVAIREGAAGYLPKTLGGNALHRALRGVLAGELAMPRALALEVMRRLAVRRADRDALAGLLPAEHELLVALAAGATPAELLARQAGVSARTLSARLGAITTKLGVRTRAEAIALLRSAGS